MALRWFERLMWAVVVAGLGVVGYNLYETWSADQSAGVEDVSYATNLIQNWQDTEAKPAIAAKGKRKEAALAKGEPPPKQCSKMAELTIPVLGGKVYNVSFSSTPDRKVEDRCLQKTPILFDLPNVTVFPGDAGLSVISGHRDTQFRALEKLFNDKMIGNYIIVNDRKNMYIYQLRKVWKVPKAQARVAKRDTKTSILLISTCHPFRFTGDAPDRALFESELVSIQPSPGFRSDVAAAKKPAPTKAKPK